MPPSVMQDIQLVRLAGAMNLKSYVRKSTTHEPSSLRREWSPKVALRRIAGGRRHNDQMRPVRGNPAMRCGKRGIKSSAIATGSSLKGLM